MGTRCGGPRATGASRVPSGVDDDRMLCFPRRGNTRGYLGVGTLSVVSVSTGPVGREEPADDVATVGPRRLTWSRVFGAVGETAGVSRRRAGTPGPVPVPARLGPDESSPLSLWFTGVLVASRVTGLTLSVPVAVRCASIPGDGTSSVSVVTPHRDRRPKSWVNLPRTRRTATRPSTPWDSVPARVGPGESGYLRCEAGRGGRDVPNAEGVWTGHLDPVQVGVPGDPL